MKHGKVSAAKIAIIAAAAVAVVAAVVMLFIFLTNVPAVEYEKGAELPKHLTDGRDITFFDTLGNRMQTITNIRRSETNSSGTMLALSTDGTLYLADGNGARTADTGVSGSHIFGLAENADVAYYEKDKKIYRNAGAPEHIGTLEGFDQFITVSPDGSSAVWGETVKQELRLYAYRGGRTELLTGADSIVFVSGDAVFGCKGGDLVMCGNGSTEFRTVCGFRTLKGVAGGGKQLLITDGSPAATYLVDSATGERVFVYNGTVEPYAPEGMKQKDDSFDLFIGAATDHSAGTYSLVQFGRDGSSYKMRKLLDLDGVSSYRVSADGKKLVYIKNKRLAVKSLVGTLAKDSVISDNAMEFCTDPTLADLYFVDMGGRLYWSGGSTPKKISLNVGVVRMLYDGVCTFISDGTLYYSENGGDITKAAGIGKAVMLTDSAALSEEGTQYITFDGKSFTDTGINIY